MSSPGHDAWVARARAVLIEQELARRGIVLKRVGVELVGPCPKCGGEDRFAVNTAKQIFNCRGCGGCGDVIALVQHLDDSDFKAACGKLAGEPPPQSHPKVRSAEPKKVVVAEYRYEDETGALAFLVERVQYQNLDGTFVLAKDGKRKKIFRRRRPNPDRPGTWLWNVNGVPILPYRVPELIEAAANERLVVIVEGERKADLLWGWKVPATCCAGGAKKWRPEHAKFLRGVDVVILPDNDVAGRNHVAMVAASLQNIAASVRVLSLPGLPPKGDIMDWAAAGGTVEQLHDLITREAKPWAVDEAADTGTEQDDEKAKQADVLIKIARATAKFWHSVDGAAFVDISVGKHRETWPVRSRHYKLWLGRLYYESRRSAPNSDAVQSALNILEANSRFDGPELPVSVRIADANDKIYIDLGTPDWSAVEIDTDGWRILDVPPVRFRRSKGMLPLPLPKHDGDVNALRHFLNVKTDEEFALIVAFLVAVLRGRGPFIVLVLTGEHGTSKSTLTRIIRTLCDPNSAPLRSLPRDDRDLFVSANNGYVLAFDNVSKLPVWLSDSLCRLATGGGFGTRELYTDSEEALFDAMRPIILNGIEDFVTRGDLADRAVALTLAEIPDDKRRDEESFWAEFNLAAPLILGALLDAIACGLKTLPHVKFARKPRMADFARWVVACEDKLPWTAGTFMRAYDGNRAESIETMLESDGVVVTLRAFLTQHTDWKGTAGELLRALNTAAAEEVRKAIDWPKTPRGMSGALRSAAPGLRKLGYTVEFSKDISKKRSRLIQLSPPVEDCQQSSEPSEPSNPAFHSAFPADGQLAQPSEQPSASKALNDKAADAADGADGGVQTSEEEAWTL
jgi:hypothetical protein